ncbi:MAG: SusC/RagA family TonB-linked outer membrane protein [Prevotella sp.]|jgi:TonB-linked SusC/RagA family outer membrane protein|nr:SusC/RagA family TonB-linked outer membrane protein [Prevotella sp.]
MKKKEYMDKRCFFISIFKTIVFIELALILLLLCPVITFANNNNPERRQLILPDLPQNSRSINGTVTDRNGEPITGANIVVKGTTNGVISDIDGNYTIQAQSGDILIISYIGFISQEITVGNQLRIDVTLQEDLQRLEEVVVVGYGTMKKKDITGAVSSVSTEKLKSEMPRTVQELLRGNIPGLEVGFSTNAQGGGYFEIRGVNSLTASSSPLLVVDGVIFQGAMSDINPYDIQTVDVLKDASSAAVYGAKAANGVILITTTKGGEGTGKPMINMSANVGYVTPGKMAHLYKSYDFIKWRQDVLRSMNWYSSPGNEKLYLFDHPDKLPAGVTMDMWMDGKTGNPEDIWLSRLGLGSLEIANYKAGKSIDWEDEVYQSGFMQDYNLSVSGTKDKTSYYWSLNYTDNDGIVTGDWYKNYRSRLKFDFDITKWLTVGINAAFAEKNESAVTANNWIIRDNSPWGSKYNDDGETLRYSPIDDPLGSVNPLYTMSHTDQSVLYRKLNANMYGMLKLPYNISYQMTFSPYYSFHEEYIHFSSKHEEYRVSGGEAIRENSTTFNWQVDNLLKWYYTFNDIHKVDATFLFNAEKNQYWSDGMLGMGFSPTDALGYHSMSSASSANIWSNDTYSTGTSLMGRLFYSFKDRYMLTTSIRRDGYSAFGINNPYGVFPAVALGWAATEEDFLKNDLFYGKLRFSWGENGNREIGIYDALSDMSVGKMTYATPTGAGYEKVLLYIENMANNDLKWERTRSFNFGLDYSIKSGLVSGSVEYYSEQTHDLLVSRVLPDVTGYRKVTTNLGEVQNKGIELNLNAKLIDKKNFLWQANVNFFLNRNKIVSLYGDMEDVYDNDGNIIGQKESDDITNEWFIGKALDRIWGPRVLGIWQQGEEEQARVYGQYPGDFKVEDVDGDERISEDDNVFQGYRNPRFRWNMRHDFNLFKNINLSFNLYSHWGHYGDYNQVAKDNGKNDRNNDFNYPYWTPETPYEQYYGRIGTYHAGSSFTVYKKRSFIRLENISVSYRMPSKICKFIQVENLTVSGSIRNAAVWAPDWDFGDPEVDNGYPAPRYFTLGINLTL